MSDEIAEEWSAEHGALLRELALWSAVVEGIDIEYHELRGMKTISTYVYLWSIHDPWENSYSMTQNGMTSSNNQNSFGCMGVLAEAGLIRIINLPSLCLLFAKTGEYNMVNK